MSNLTTEERAERMGGNVSLRERRRWAEWNRRLSEPRRGDFIVAQRADGRWELCRVVAVEGGAVPTIRQIRPCGAGDGAARGFVRVEGIGHVPTIAVRVQAAEAAAAGRSWATIAELAGELAPFLRPGPRLWR